MKRVLLNPFILYILAYGLVLILYQAHWSELFPPLDSSLLIFFIATGVLSGLLGYKFQRYRKNIVSSLSLKESFFSKSIKFIIIGYCLEFAYAKRIPLLSLSAIDDSFEHFGGIPTLHVVLVTYTVFFSVVYFQKILQDNEKKREWLRFVIIGIMPPLLMVNRGMLFTIFISCLLMYLSLSTDKLRNIFFKCGILISVLLFVFSVLGQLRINDSNENRAFISFAKPSKKFNDLRLDPIILWPYMYMASPIANLDNCIEKAKPEYDLNKFFWICICPDFISKRIVNESLQPTKDYLISPVFNVSTMYYRAYITMGYYGMTLLFIYQAIIVIVFLFTSTPKNNQYFTVTFCLISSTIILGTFSNMWIFSAVSFPILWSPILNIFSKCKMIPKL